MDAGAPFVEGRGVDAAQFEPPGDVFQGDAEIARMRVDVRGDPLPAKGAVFSAEMVIVLGWEGFFHPCDGIVPRRWDQAISGPPSGLEECLRQRPALGEDGEVVVGNFRGGGAEVALGDFGGDPIVACLEVRDERGMPLTIETRSVEVPIAV